MDMGMRTAHVVAEGHGKEIRRVKNVIETLRVSLEFYAKKSNWITINCSDKLHDKHSCSW